MRDKITEYAFTIMELLVVVTIIGALSSVAIPSFTNYVRKARSVETTESLNAIATGAKAYFAQHRLLPVRSRGYVPKMTHKRVCRRYGGVFPENTTETGFDSEPWRALLFTPAKNIRYRYYWLPKNQPAQRRRRRVYGRAFLYSIGDLDCDNLLSRRQIILREMPESPGQLTQFGPFVVSGTELE